MKLKRFAGFGLALIMTFSSLNVGFAKMAGEGNDTNRDIVLSDSAVEVENEIVAMAESGVEFAGGDGSEENPYKIATAEQLAYMHNNLSAHYMLICDIDMSGQVWLPVGQSIPTGWVVPPFKDNNNFEPYEDVFEGAFNGNGYAITNLTIKGDEIYDVGLFGCANNKSVIENVQLKNVSIVANKINTDYVEQWKNNAVYAMRVGGVVGCSNGIVRQCSVNGNIEVLNCNDAYVGGIAGFANATNCTNYANIYALCNRDSRFTMDAEGHIGGIVGHTTAVSGTLSDCVNYGNVKSDCGNFLYCGGISGEDGAIKNCINYGNVKGNILYGVGTSSFAYNCNVGGIVGATSGSVIRCVNEGEVTATIDGDTGNNVAAGGIAGYNGYYSDGRILQSFNNSNSIKSYYYYEEKPIKYSCSGRICGSNIGGISDCYSYFGTRVNLSIPTNNIGKDQINGETISNEELNKRLCEIFAIRFDEPDSNIIGENGIIVTLPTTKGYEIGTFTDMSNCLIANLKPHIDDKSGITWESSNPDIVEIVDTSYIDGTSSDSLLCNLNCKAVGTSTVTVTTADGASASCLVTVTEKELKVVSTKIDNDIKGDKIVVSLDGIALDYVMQFNTPIEILDDSKIIICRKEDAKKDYSLINSLRTPKNCYIDKVDNTKLHINYNFRDYQTKSNDTIVPLEYGYSIPLNTELCVLIDSNAISAVDKSYNFSGILYPVHTFKTTSGIEFFKDTYNFYHNTEAFFDGIEPQHYALSKEATDLLIENGVSSKKIDNYKYVEDWNGSCGGLSVVNMLIKYGVYSPNDFQDDAKTTFDLNAPKTNTKTKGLRDTINYYQLYHNNLVDRHLNYRKFLYDGEDGKKIGWNCDYQSVLKELVERYKNVNIDADFPTTNDALIPFGFRYDTIENGKIVKKIGGHVIIPYDVKEENERYELYCYDVNRAWEPLILFISKDFANLSFSDEYYNDWVYIGYANMSEYLRLSPYRTYRNRSISNNPTDTSTNKNTVIKISSNGDFIVDNGKKSFTYANGKFSGDVDIIKSLDMTDSIEGYASDFIFGLDNSEIYTITSLSDNLEFQYENKEMFMYIDSTGTKEVELNYNTKDINVAGNNLTYKMSVSSNLTNNSLLSVTGKAKNNIRVGYNNNNAVITANNTENIKAELIVDGEISDTKEYDANSIIEIKNNAFITETITEKQTETTTKAPVTTTERQTEATTKAPITTTEKQTEATTKAPITTTEKQTETSTAETTETTTRVYSQGHGGSSGGGSSKKAAKTTKETTTEVTTKAVTEKQTEATTSVAISDVKVTIGSKKVEIGSKAYDIDVAPYIQSASNSTLVPLRFVALAIAGGNIENADNSKNIMWDAVTKTATITYNNNTIKFTAGSTDMVINGKAQLMENGVKAEIADGRMFVPFRALGNALGVSVDWDAKTKTAIYKTK